MPASRAQIEALLSKADVLGYGGAAGGGKTDLLLGLAVTRHQRALICRREAVQVKGLEDRAREIIGAAGRYNGSAKVWRLNNGRMTEFGSVREAHDWRKYQGRPYDLIAFDEAANFLETQVRALMGWNRTTMPDQRCRVVMAFNPPTSADGAWIIDYFGPWLDRRHPDPAKPGELRWYVIQLGLDDRDVVVEQQHSLGLGDATISQVPPAPDRELAGGAEIRLEPQSLVNNQFGLQKFQVHGHVPLLEQQADQEDHAVGNPDEGLLHFRRQVDIEQAEQGHQARDDACREGGGALDQEGPGHTQCAACTQRWGKAAIRSLRGLQ